jgi:hypothetical protein
MEIMTREAAVPVDVTPLGGLEEGGIHGLLGNQLAQAALLTTEVLSELPVDLSSTACEIHDLAVGARK